MKISTFVLSVSALFIIYVCYADWIDELFEVLAEDYLGFDYEEVAPFVPSVTAGVEEFDSIAERLSGTPKTRVGPYIAVAVLAALALLALVSVRVLSSYRSGASKHRGTLVPSEFPLSEQDSESLGEAGDGDPIPIESRKPRRTSRSTRTGENVPVRVIWKGNDMTESSIRCNLKSEQEASAPGTAKAPLPYVGGGGDPEELPPTTGSAVRRLADIRRLLQSERRADRKSGCHRAGTPEDSTGSAMTELRERLESDASTRPLRSRRRVLRPARPLLGDEADAVRDDEEDESRTRISLDFSTDSLCSACEDAERGDSSADPKLMNRIRILESRLRLEELKNRNWIDRMSRAEGILQQLNKQVERMERTRPMETMLTRETLKITGTVTDWMTLGPTARNLHFTLVERYSPPRFHHLRSESLTDYVRREIALPYSAGDPRRMLSLPKSPLVPALPPPMVAPQTSILSRLLSK